MKKITPLIIISLFTFVGFERSYNVEGSRVKASMISSASVQMQYTDYDKEQAIKNINRLFLRDTLIKE